MTKLKSVLYGDTWWLVVEANGQRHKLYPQAKAGQCFNPAGSRLKSVN